MVNINSLERDGLRQAELCPRHTMKMKMNNLALVRSCGHISFFSFQLIFIKLSGYCSPHDIAFMIQFFLPELWPSVKLTKSCFFNSFFSFPSNFQGSIVTTRHGSYSVGVMMGSFLEKIRTIFSEVLPRYSLYQELFINPWALYKILISNKSLNRYK